MTTNDSRQKQQVHFEQLVREPRAVMDRLCHWLGIPFEPATLDPHAHLPAVLEPKLGDPKVQRHTGIDPTVADSWRRQYSEHLLDTPTWRSLGVPTRELMARWGIA